MDSDVPGQKSKSDKGKGLVPKSRRKRVTLNSIKDPALTSVSESPAEVVSADSKTQDGICDPSVPALEFGVNITRLSDEILLKIFSMVNSVTVLRSVNRVCKRWNLLCKDKYLWRRVDLRFVGLKPKRVASAVRQYCSEITKSLLLRAVSKRYYGDVSSRARCKAPKCLTRSVVTNITRTSPNLENLSIICEQIASTLCPSGKGFFSCLPDTLTHLSLAFCNLGTSAFLGLFAKNFPLKRLLSLDLNSIFVSGSAYLSELEHELPPTLTELSVRDIVPCISLYGLINVITKHESLLSLDIGVNHIAIENLSTLSTRLKNLMELNISGCLLADYSATAFGIMEHRPVSEEEWFDIFKDGFPSLTRLNVRNVRQNSGEILFRCMDCLRKDIVNFIDTDGTIRGEWSDEMSQPDDIEFNKYDFKVRYERERKDYIKSVRYRPNRFRHPWGEGWGEGDPFLDSDDNSFDLDESEDEDNMFPDPFNGRRDECRFM